MGKIIRRVIILANIFLAAIMIYFVWSQNTIEELDVVYTSMEESALPLVYTEMSGYNMNCLRGYRQEMETAAARETLTILPADRRLNIKLENPGQQITGARYEIRNMQLDQLVERTEIDEIEALEEGILTTLPIQNLLNNEEEYLLHLFIETEQYGTIHYYTRILWTEKVDIKAMLDLAAEFSEKTLDYDQARDLVTYLESNEMADNSTFGRVTIESSFSQLTWGGLKVRRIGDIQITLKELDGIMGQVQVDYLVAYGEEAEQEIYEVRDYYTMKWNAQRIYLMDYARETNQIFAGKENVYSGKRILMGIMNEEQMQVKRSNKQRYLAYVVNRDLWCYDQQEGQSTYVFSFRNGLQEIENSYNQHNVKVVSVTDEGDIYFLVYGYMNRGKNEGYLGVSLYQYSHENRALEERFFIPATGTFEMLANDISQLTYLRDFNLLYLLLGQSIYAIDINSNEYMIVAEGLKSDRLAISLDQQYIAWQENSSENRAVINWMSLETGRKEQIETSEDAQMEILGYVGHDFIYGLYRPDEQWQIHGRKTQYPLYALEIVNDQLMRETRYEKDDKRFTNIKVSNGRIHIDRLVATEGNQYRWLDQDTIVCNEEVADTRLDGIGWYASKDKGKLYFVQLTEEIKAKSRIQILKPKKITYHDSEILSLQTMPGDGSVLFYAYERGHLRGVSENLSEAIMMAYDYMGVVIDSNQNMVWNRVNRRNYMTIDNPQAAAYPILQQLGQLQESTYSEDLLIMDGMDCTIQQMLYFVDKGYPVVAYTAEDNYLLISGFDTHNISIYDPGDKNIYKMGIQAASEYFAALQNDFICAVLVK